MKKEHVKADIEERISSTSMPAEFHIHSIHDYPPGTPHVQL